MDIPATMSREQVRALAAGLHRSGARNAECALTGQLKFAGNSKLQTVSGAFHGA